MRYEPSLTLVKDTENPHGGAICSSSEIARKLSEHLNCQSIIDGILADRAGAELLAMLASRELVEMRGQ